MNADDARKSLDQVESLIQEKRKILDGMITSQSGIAEKKADLQQQLKLLEEQEQQITTQNERIEEIDDELAELLTGKKPDGRKRKNRTAAAIPATDAPPKRAYRRRVAADATTPDTTTTTTPPEVTSNGSATDVSDLSALTEEEKNLKFLREVLGPQMPHGLKGSELIQRFSELGYGRGYKDPSSVLLQLLQDGQQNGWLKKDLETKKYTLTGKALEGVPVG
jgi:hypothetical protein